MQTYTGIIRENGKTCYVHVPKGVAKELVLSPGESIKVKLFRDTFSIFKKLSELQQDNKQATLFFNDLRPEIVGKVFDLTRNDATINSKERAYVIPLELVNEVY